MVRGMLKMRNVRSKGTFHIPLGTVRNLSSVPRPLHPSLKRTVSTRPTDLTRLSVPVWIGPKRGTVKVRRLCLFQNMTIVASSAFKYVLILGFILEIWKCIFSNFQHYLYQQQLKILRKCSPERVSSLVKQFPGEFPWSKYFLPKQFPSEEKEEDLKKFCSKMYPWRECISGGNYFEGNFYRQETISPGNYFEGTFSRELLDMSERF